ncbi:MAG: hypothetical protein AB7P40_30915 [Chloroflexota bacterium]
MLVDEIIRALRDPEYRAQLMGEVHGALPDRYVVRTEPAESDEESGSES